ncbi:MAG: sodium:proton antiporter, partial [Pseudomonadota bacterium]
MTPQAFLDLSVQIALVLLSVSFIITIARVISGPTLPDRVLALDLLVAAAIGF